MLDSYFANTKTQRVGSLEWPTLDVKNVKKALLQRLLIAETIESGSATMTEVSLNEYGSYEIPIGPDYEFPGGIF